MKKLALSVRQPWAWLIINNFKDVENRSWEPPENIIGKRIYIHAGQSRISKEDFAEWYDLFFKKERLKTFPKSLDDFAYGYIVGSVKIDGVTTKSKSPWAQPGAKHWIISEPKKIKPIAFKGQLKLFDVSGAFKK